MSDIAPADLLPSPALDGCAFDAAEAVIERGQATFLEVGRAILAIREQGRAEMRGRGYPTFEDYMRRRWGWSRQQGYALIEAVSVAENVKPVLHSERLCLQQAHVLAPLPAPEQRHAWAQAVRTSDDGRPRVSDLRRIVREMEAEKKAERLAAPPIERPAAPAEIAARIEVADATALPLPAESVDLIVSSPPYGLDKPYRDTGDSAEGWPLFMFDWLCEAHRVARVGGRLALNVPLDTTFGGTRPTYSQAIQAAQDAGWLYRWTVVWAENNVSKSLGRGSVDSPSAPHVVAPVEMIGVFCKQEWPRRLDSPIDLEHDEWLEWTNGLWTFNGEARAWENHPAAFPPELPRRVIRLLSYVGDVVLDPFCGSGTTPLVATRLGRQAIGFDLSPEYVASARRRLAAAGGA